MNKAAPHVPPALLYPIEQMVHDIIADIGAGAVGQHRRYTLLPQGLDHGPGGKGAEVGRLAIGLNRFVHGSVTLIVWNAGILEVDGHPLYRNGGTAPGLTDADHNFRPVGVYQLFQDQGPLVEDHGQLRLDNLCATNSIGQFSDCLQGWIHGLPAKGRKTCYQDLHGHLPLC